MQPGEALPLLVLVLAMGASAAGVDRALRTRDGETLFWVGFTAFFGVLLAAAWALAATPAGSVPVGLTLLAGTAVAAGWVSRRDRRRRRERKRQQLQAAVQGTVLRHRKVLARWSAYELDPWLAAEHPLMLDVRSPETREFIRALKTAEQLKGETDSAAGAVAYARAVAGLEASLERAEKAAGGGRAA